MDAFTDALRSLRLRDFKPGLSERRAPWGTYYPGKTWDVVFYAIKGEPCWLTVDSMSESIRVSDNSICILPHGHAHALRDLLETVPQPIRHLRPEGYHGLMKYGAEAGPHTLVYLGRFQLDHSGRNPLWDSLPPVIHLRLAHTPTWVDTLFSWFREELSTQHTGHASVCSRIGELLIIQSIRTYIEQLSEKSPNFLSALRDPHLLKALNLLHDQSERAWTLQILAQEVGISRSRLAARFSAYFGEGPLHYLTNWRMKKAAILLIETDLKISMIVEKVGYQSEPSFNIAFRKLYGVPPGQYRKQHRQPTDTSAARNASLHGFNEHMAAQEGP